MLYFTEGLLVCLYFVLFFFFKQKTAYEMRISDWSSDVCSSDLEPKAIPIGRSERGRWVSLRSTHPTLASRGDPPDNRPVGAAMAAMAFREEHRGHCRSHKSTCGSGLVPDAVPGCLPHLTEVALQVKPSRRRNRLPAVAFAPRHGVAEEVVRFAPHAQVAEHQFAVGHLRAHEAVVEPGQPARGGDVLRFGQRLRVRAMALEHHRDRKSVV